MSLVDYTYFVRDINVPINAASTSDANYVKITDSINKYENEVLKSLLGYTLWKEMTTAYAASIAETPVALPSKWDEFINGAEFEFEYDGQTISTKWEGLKNSDKVSLIAYYVYYCHRINNQTNYTGIGETQAKGENSVAANGSYKIVNAWNKMVDLYGYIPYPYCKSKNFFYEVDNYVHYNDYPSAYNFLLANKASYTGWVFAPKPKKHNYF